MLAMVGNGCDPGSIQQAALGVSRSISRLLLISRLGSPSKWRPSNDRTCYWSAVTSKPRAGAPLLVDARVQSALSREFGVAWVPRPDGRCNEIAGITQEVMDAYSTRTQAVTAEGARLARKWQEKYGREPNTREMRFILDEANLTSRKSKENGEVCLGLSR
jgi:hypothetical protein